METLYDFFTNDAPVFHPLVLTAVAFVVFCGAENLGTEKAVSFRFKSSIIDSFRLLDLPMRPF